MAEPARYAANDYWDKRYKKDVAEKRAFEWYAAFPVLAHIVRQYVPRTASVLHVGCGNSPWVADMVADGHTGRIANVDISPVITEYMREKHADLPPNVTWEIGDVTRLKAHGDSTFDAVIDKGTMDALMCGGDSTGNTAAMAREMLRVLRPGGVFVMITYGDPNSRLFVLEPLGWDITLHMAAKKLTDRKPGEPPAWIGPLSLSAGMGAWESKLKGITLDEYHFIYVCHKRQAATTERK